MSSSQIGVGTVDLRRPISGPLVVTHPREPLVISHAIAPTLLRIPVGAVGVVLLFSPHMSAAIPFFVAFALLDVADGLVARRHDADGASRRSMDVLIDRTFIHLASMSCAFLYETGYALVLALLARDVIQGTYSGYMAFRRSVVFIGPKWHMSYWIAFLLWGGHFILTGHPGAVLSVLLALVSLSTILDFFRLTQRPLQASA